MDIYKIEKPVVETKFEKVFELLNQPDTSRFIEKANRPEYLHWSKLKHKPRPNNWTAEEYWSVVKMLRRLSQSKNKTDIIDEKGAYFTWNMLPGFDKFLHEIDMELGGRLKTSSLSSKLQKQRFITRGIMEEAIASSQLEGANTTRKIAKKMLLEKRKPRTKSETMILNNYNAMRTIEDHFKDSNLDKSMLFELHSILTNNTIDDSDIGRFRTDADEIIVRDTASNLIYHLPPSKRFLIKAVNNLIKFANDQNQSTQFIHPVIKAILIHFWIGYLHPFTDGNGRLARTLFYWYLLRHDYWGFMYLPISRIIKNSPAQYRDAFVYTEQDDNDLTYFIDYNVRKIEQAKLEFDKYLKRKEDENKLLMSIAESQLGLNDRQIQLLRFLYNNENDSTAIKTHSQIYELSRKTARKDLENLKSKGLLTSHKSGRTIIYKGTDKLKNIFDIVK